jgi:hypothetical protein
LLVGLSLFALLVAGMPGRAWAGQIGTPTAIAAQVPAETLARVSAVLGRDDVRERLVALGVDPADAARRVAALTPAEAARLAEQLERAPAGGDVLGILGIVFLVLLALEFTGTIDIFKKVP